MYATGLIAAALLAATVAAADDFEYSPFEDFEDCSAWIKGDPNTDMTQREVGVAPSSEFVHEGEQSLAFMIRVDWTPKPGQQYAKGWPMLNRELDPPLDWSAWDRVFFWLYTQTEDPLPQDRVLRVGFFGEGEEARGGPWYTIPDIVPNEWKLVSVPLDAERDWTRVNRISFYVAEGWYQDGDRVNFYIDDMQLARRISPALQSAAVASRTGDRGSLVVEVALEGRPDPARHSVRCTVTDLDGGERGQMRWRLEERAQRFEMDLHGVPPGSHYALVELMDGEGAVLDSRRQYFRSLEPGRRTYLQLISFYSSGQWNSDDLSGLAVLNDSAYAAVALPFWGAYDTDPVEDWEELLPRLDEARDILDIDPWPWVFSNRFIGSPEDARGHASGRAGNLEYFRRIPILDLDNETGARADMMKMWRLAVRAALYWGSPGIVLDLEAYNNYPSYRVRYAADRRGESPAEVIRRCELVGEDLAKIVEEIYPECIIWTLFSRLDSAHRLPDYDGDVYPVPGHISLGFLRYAKAHDLPCKYLCGGELTPGYYNPNVAALEEKIVTRDRDLAPILEQFPRHFFLAGTISPYHDFSINTGFMKDRPGENPEIRTLDDFAPMFEALFTAYDWNWIYASSAAKTMPYDPEHNAMYREALERALEAAAR